MKIQCVCASIYLKRCISKKKKKDKQTEDHNCKGLNINKKNITAV